MDNLITEYILPTKILFKSDNVKHAENLLIKKDEQIGLNEKSLCVVEGKGFILLDFDMEYAGGTRILTYGVSNAQASVRLRFGESVSECFSELGEKGACNDHSPRDFVAPICALSDLTYGKTGFRFLRIDFLSDAVVTLKNVYCAFTRREFPNPSPIEIKDQRIAEIFIIAVRTVQLCCQQYLWDGIKRDRLVWVGDMHPEMLALTSLYGRCEIIEKSLDFSIAQYPADTWMNNMPMYSAWLLIILADYYPFNKEYVKTKKQYAVALLKNISDCVNSDGSLDFPTYFVDWPTHEQVDELAGCRALLTVCANKCEGLFDTLGWGTQVAKELRAKLSKTSISVEKAKQVVALKYWALGELSEQDKKLLVSGGAKGLSTFMSYYILKAVAETCGVDTAIDMLKEYYGGMLDKGATTFFEDFDMDWVENTCRLDELPKDGERDIHGDFGKYCYEGFRHSFCHGWSTGIITFIYEYCK